MPNQIADVDFAEVVADQVQTRLPEEVTIIEDRLGARGENKEFIDMDKMAELVSQELDVMFPVDGVIERLIAEPITITDDPVSDVAEFSKETRPLDLILHEDFSLYQLLHRRKVVGMVMLRNQKDGQEDQKAPEGTVKAMVQPYGNDTVMVGPHVKREVVFHDLDVSLGNAPLLMQAYTDANEELAMIFIGSKVAIRKGALNLVVWRSVNEEEGRAVYSCNKAFFEARGYTLLQTL